MSIIKIKSPTRVDLAGGTLDLWPLYLFIGGSAMTINVAIDIWTEAEITPLDSSEIILESKDLNLKKSYVNIGECLRDQDSQIKLLQVQLKYWRQHSDFKKGFHLKTSSQSPVGGGLGGSSSLTISLLKAFAELCRYQFKNNHEMVKVASNIEAEVLNTPTGTQDYYPAISGGINILNFNYEGISQEVLPADPNLSERFMLVHTGKAHHSGLNNFEVMQRAVAKDPQTISALKALNKISEQAAAACKAKKWQDLAGLFEQEYRERIRLAPAFSSPEIEKLNSITREAGASSLKICGAGGGGCVLVWVEPGHREPVRSVCQKAGFQVLTAKPV